MRSRPFQIPLLTLLLICGMEAALNGAPIGLFGQSWVTWLALQPATESESEEAAADPGPEAAAETNAPAEVPGEEDNQEAAQQAPGAQSRAPERRPSSRRDDAASRTSRSDSSARSGSRAARSRRESDPRREPDARRESDPRRRDATRADRTRPQPPSDDRNRRPDEKADPNSSSSSSLGAFGVIVQRNIFDASRSPRSARARNSGARSAANDSFTLVGTIAYEKGAYAFFDGSRPDYRKALELGKSIAGYRVAEITAHGVRLTKSTDAIELEIGMQMRRDEDGWHASGNRFSPALAAPQPTEASAPETAADQDEVLKRLMQRRALEMQ